MSLLTDISNAIKVDLPSFSDDFSGSNILAMKKFGWEEAAKKVKAEANSGIVVEEDISNGSVDSGTNSDWGLDLFNSSIRESLLNGSTLFPYFCNTTFKKKYVLFVDSKVYKFSNVVESHFNTAKSAVPDYAANHFFTNDTNYSNSSNATSSLARANAIVVNQYTE
tara:strand:+ start:124 stop:621 length:498 start_codon:yes stop_codon:yes gene_type:complete